MPVLSAIPADIPVLLPLINSAFRGDTSRQGWTHEADLLDGLARTDEATLLEMLLDPNATMLKYLDDAGRLLGCVYLLVKPRGLYLGMLTVSPQLQGAGIGKQLLAAAEEVARKSDCASIYMTVISVRQELIAWYERHGYRFTGETQPFPDNNKFGTPTQPLEFVILEKKVS